MVGRNTNNRRRQGNNSRSQGVTKKFSWTARENDANVVRGSIQPIQVASTASGTQTYTFALNPTTISGRVSAMATYYERYKIKALKIKYVSGVSSSTAGVIVYGIVDDVDNAAAGSLSGSFDQLRTSNSQSIWKDSQVIYTPVDPNKWYYTNTNTVGDTTSDPRLSQPCTMVWQVNIAPASTTFGYFYIEYIMVFKGATVPGLT